MARRRGRKRFLPDVKNILSGRPLRTGNLQASANFPARLRRRPLNAARPDASNAVRLGTAPFEGYRTTVTTRRDPSRTDLIE